MTSDKPQLANIWRRLADENQENLAKPAGFWPGGLILATLTPLGLPSLIIEFQGETFDFDLRVKGLEIRQRQLEVSGRLANCVQISPSNETTEKIFMTLSDHLLGELQEEEFQAGTESEVEKAINVWVDFMKELRGENPRERIIGLIGELLAIRDILDTSCLEPQNWQGPMGGIQDFVTENDALEVKTGTNRNGALHHKISGLHQLRAPKGGRLFVQSFRIDLGKKGEEKLIDLIEQVRAMPLFSSSKAQRYFDESLLNAGYSDDLDQSLSHFSVLDSKTYLVSEGFPRLDPTNTSTDSRILEVKYTLDFSQLDEFLIQIDKNKLTLE
jgi:hypothetical protein